MDQPNGHPCPECGAPRHADHTPSCACTRRTADALRDARTAEAAAAEDFDPLRIRPYVDLNGTSPDGLPEATKGTPPAPGTPRATAQGDASPGAAGAPGAHPGAADPSAPAGGPAAHDGTPAPEDRRTTATRAGHGERDASDATMTLKAIGPDAAKPDKATRGPAPAAPHAGGPADTATAPREQAGHTDSPAGAAPGGPRESVDGGVPESPDATVALRAVRPEGAAPGTPSREDRTSVLPTPLAPGTAPPNADDLGLFDDATRPLRTVSAGAALPRPEAAAPRSRRRRGALIAASGAVVAVLGAAGWASGLFSYETPSRNTAAPDDVRASVPDAASEASSAQPSSEAPSASPGASASASQSPSASASASGSPSPSASSAAPSASATAEPSVTPSADGASSAPAVAPEPEEPVGTAPVLRRGDRGPEVVELQQRLREVWLYQGDADGRYSHRVEEAVRHYQWSRGIDEELGVYGPQTRSRLESETGAS
ncbi:hypothetical protein SUDANB60_01892 [Streptomyces sp. enrichment culture]